jgi:hypothetical protein
MHERDTNTPLAYPGTGEAEVAAAAVEGRGVDGTLPPCLPQRGLGVLVSVEQRQEGERRVGHTVTVR